MIRRVLVANALICLAAGSTPVVHAAEPEAVVATSPGSASPSLEASQLDLHDTNANDSTVANAVQTVLTPPPPNTAPEEQRRGLPAPLSSPPFPSSEWQLGGTNPIGVPDTDEPGPLMKIIYSSPYGDAWKKSRVKLYGWVDVGANLSSSKHSNAPAAYSIYPNTAQLDQLLLRVERKPDSAQTDHMDWGFRFDNLYGQNYRFTTMKGIFSQQLLRKNHRYGYDPVMFYGDIYVPWVAKGMNIRIGRYISLPDIEAQLAPDNYMYTHSLLYAVDPYTQMGIVTTTKLTNQLTLQLGVCAGNDIAPWSYGAKWTPLGFLQWTTKSNNDSFYGGVNSINGGKYAYNNVQMFVGTWSHRFNKRVHTATESYYMYEKGVPARALPAGVRPGYAPAWGVLNFLEIKLNDKNAISIRNEYFDDVKGQRTGYKTGYSEHAIGLTHWLSKTVTLRPEFRYEHAYERGAYNRGTKQDQFIGAVDMIVHF